MKTNPIAARVLRMILALPYLPATRQGEIIPSMVDGFHSIIEYVNQYPEIAAQLDDFLLNYVWAYWFDTVGQSAITVYNQDIRTNNYIETYHASILKIIKPHPKVWEFLAQLLFLENQYYIEFRQLMHNLRIRNSVPTSARVQNTTTIREFLEELAQDVNPDRIVTFLRRAGHRVDGYISQEIGPHPGEEELLINAGQ